jgi:hypothetical protein
MGAGRGAGWGLNSSLCEMCPPDFERKNIVQETKRTLEMLEGR